MGLCSRKLPPSVLFPSATLTPCKPYGEPSPTPSFKEITTQLFETDDYHYGSTEKARNRGEAALPACVGDFEAGAALDIEKA